MLHRAVHNTRKPIYLMVYSVLYKIYKSALTCYGATEREMNRNERRRGTDPRLIVTVSVVYNSISRLL